MTISKFFTPTLTFLLILGGTVPAQANIWEISSHKKTSLHQLAQDHQAEQINAKNQQDLPQPSLEVAHHRFGRRGFGRRGFRRSRSFRRGGFRRSRGFRRGGFKRVRNFRKGNFRHGNFRHRDFKIRDYEKNDFLIKRIIIR